MRQRVQYYIEDDVWCSIHLARNHEPVSVREEIVNHAFFVWYTRHYYTRYYVDDAAYNSVFVRMITSPSPPPAEAAPVPASSIADRATLASSAATTSSPGSVGAALTGRTSTGQPLAGCLYPSPIERTIRRARGKWELMNSRRP